MSKDGPTDQKNLRGFTSANKRVPILRKEAAVETRVKSKGHIRVGYRGPIPARETYGFVGFRRHDEHYHKKLEGYALSDKVLRLLRSFGCKIILIAETDTRTVYEFHERQFTESVPQWAKGSNEKEEAQSYVKLAENWGVFDAHTPYVMLGERDS